MSQYPRKDETLAQFIVRTLLECNRLAPDHPKSIMSNEDVVGDCLSGWRCIHDESWAPTANLD